MDSPIQELRERASSLRREAFRLLEDRGVLDTIRDALGPVEVVGSVALDLMVWRDIDLSARLERGEGGRLLALASVLHERLAREGFAVVKVSFNDEYRRPGNSYGHGLYLGLRVLPPDGGEVWKVDLWGWDRAGWDAQMRAHRRLAAELATADRDVVLRIKDAVHRRREYRDTLTSMDVYDFAIARAGETAGEFDAFVARRRGGAAS